MSYRVTTLSADGNETATFNNDRDARDHAAMVADLYADEGTKIVGSVHRSKTIKVIDTFAGETIALIRIEGIN